MNDTKPLKESLIIALIVLCVFFLLFLILKPVFSSDKNTNIRLPTANSNLAVLKGLGLPKSYSEIELVEKIKIEAPVDIADPSSKEKVIPDKPAPVIVPEKIIIREKVIIKEVVKKPTEIEKAIAKGIASRIGVPGFKPIKLDSKKKDENFIRVALKEPGSKYIVTAGTAISAVSLSAVDSGLPGRCVAQIDRNIYDSVLGRYLLIPQGSKLIGSYKSNAKFSQKRLEVVWKDIKLPNGASINLGKGMLSIGTQGVSGMACSVNQHLLRNAFGIFSVALLNSSAKQISTASSGSLGDEVSGEVAKDVANAGSDVLKKMVRLGPTLTVPIGSPVRVLLHRDLIFKEPYHANKTL